VVLENKKTQYLLLIDVVCLEKPKPFHFNFCFSNKVKTTKDLCAVGSDHTVNLKKILEGYVQKLVHLFSVAIIYFFITYSHLCYSQEINVGFEPFPPLINEDGSGLVVDILNTLSAGKNLHFNFHIMTYGRAKKDLKSKRLELIGLTPYQLETKKFYQYGVELNWHIDTHVDFFSLNKDYFNIEQLPDGSIGTLIGNKEFFSEIINVPVIKFVEVSSLKQLVKMLALGRLSVILFERVSTMSTIKELKIENIYYKEMGIVPASLAVLNSKEGLMLKTQLDNLLLNLDNEEYFSEFINYTSMNVSGKVIIQ
jgi:polar amino acid transport system substrate-binding protein